MTAIRPERLDADRAIPENRSGEICSEPEVSGKARRRHQAAATGFEGEIREFVRRDVAFLRRQRTDAETAGPIRSPKISMC